MEPEFSAIAKAESYEPAVQEGILRLVFDHSRKLGASLARYSARVWSVFEITELLRDTRLACLTGSWRRETGGALSLVRSGCPTGAGRFACAYWREAVDGLVMGVGGEARFARHRSLGAGNDGCHDVFYDQRLTEYRLGQVPLEIESILLPVCRRLAESGVNLEMHGYAESTLYYRLAGKDIAPCGTGRQLLLNAFYRKANAHFPGVKLVDSSPRAVMGGE